ncbi:hypothetical protein Ciccas_011528 [Cichlidogyrus casuarinus]|uniref:Uncharacterized protein n=1 Tax=Cichlidogyrus casuarinus TaxID=1844966 RepID=A0ABD2PQZ7_9PLAT
MSISNEFDVDMIKSEDSSMTKMLNLIFEEKMSKGLTKKAPPLIPCVGEAFIPNDLVRAMCNPKVVFTTNHTKEFKNYFNDRDDGGKLVDMNSPEFIQEARDICEFGSLNHLFFFLLTTQFKEPIKDPYNTYRNLMKRVIKGNAALTQPRRISACYDALNDFLISQDARQIMNQNRATGAASSKGVPTKQEVLRTTLSHITDSDVASALSSPLATTSGKSGQLTLTLPKIAESKKADDEEEQTIIMDTDTSYSKHGSSKEGSDKTVTGKTRIKESTRSTVETESKRSKVESAKKETAKPSKAGLAIEEPGKPTKAGLAIKEPGKATKAGSAKRQTGKPPKAGSAMEEFDIKLVTTDKVRSVKMCLFISLMLENQKRKQVEQMHFSKKT